MHVENIGIINPYPQYIGTKKFSNILTHLNEVLALFQLGLVEVTSVQHCILIKKCALTHGNMSIN